MYDSKTITDAPFTGEDPLGPVATMSSVSSVPFGAREAVLAGVGRGMTDSTIDELSPVMLTWHITCSSVTLATGGLTEQ
jgi:hypothetical protein